MDWDYNEIERVLTEELEMIKPGDKVPGYEEGTQEDQDTIGAGSNYNSGNELPSTPPHGISNNKDSITTKKLKPKRHHYDCSLHPLNEYIKYRRMGMSQETLRNSVLIREGRMTREEALEKEEMVRKEEPEILKDAMKEWNVRSEDINWDGDWKGLW